MKIDLVKTSSLAVFSLLASQVLNAETIASYGFNDVATSQDSQADTIAGDFLIGPGINPFAYSGVLHEGTKSAFFNNDSFNSTTEALAITRNDYLTFSVDVDAGFEVGFSSLIFYSLRRPTAGAGAPDSFALYTSQDSFTTAVGFGNLAAASSDSSTDFELNTIALSSITALQNVTDSTEFRLYLWASGGIGGTSEREFRIDDFVLDGAVASTAIPEPASFALLLISAVGILAFQRRTSRRD